MEVYFSLPISQQVPNNLQNFLTLFKTNLLHPNNTLSHQQQSFRAPLRFEHAARGPKIEVIRKGPTVLYDIFVRHT
jgi:hypothetical protein